MIKDVNIALSKLDKISVQSEVSKKHLQLIKEELKTSYNEYMAAIEQNPDIKLTDDEGLEATKKV